MEENVTTGSGRPTPQVSPKGKTVRFGALIVLLLVAVVFAVTNPSVNDFADHMLKKFPGEEESALARGVINTIGKGYIEAATERDNYVLFSTFTMTDGPLSAKFIGFLNGFFIQVSP
ncbi:MAG: hypothetical protein E7L01_01975 [Paenibacillus macerans]|uniref:hypothetical protein n=1 Tax=Paenibacillus TaxID=44249 RepID=UPI00290F97A2|nr:hypothetical protein [Paenibacillus macerans]MDU7472118.1 hypothetical protein [Paenibacillus macerans]